MYLTDVGRHLQKNGICLSDIILLFFFTPFGPIIKQITDHDINICHTANGGQLHRCEPVGHDPVRVYYGYT